MPNSTPQNPTHKMKTSISLLQSVIKELEEERQQLYALSFVIVDKLEAIEEAYEPLLLSKILNGMLEDFGAINAAGIDSKAVQS